MKSENTMKFWDVDFKNVTNPVNQS
jgi:hypothetical protein